MITVGQLSKVRRLRLGSTCFRCGAGIKQQRYRASGLSLVTAAIVLWNTTYLYRAEAVRFPLST